MSFPSNDGISHRYNHEIFTRVFGIFLSKCIEIHKISEVRRLYKNQIFF